MKRLARLASKNQMLPERVRISGATVTGTDGNIVMELVTPFAFGLPALVSASRLATAIGTKGAKVEREGNTLKVRAGATKWDLPLAPADDFPSIPLPPEDNDGMVQVSGELLHALANVAASDPIARPALSSVAIYPNGFAATDSYKVLHLGDLTGDPMLVPANVIELVPNDEPIDVVRVQGMVRCEWDGGWVQGRGVGSEYPNMAALLSRFTGGYKTSLTVERATLIAAAKATLPLRDNKRFDPAQINFEESGLRVGMVEAKRSDSVETQVVAQEGGVVDAATIGCNPGFLIQALQGFRGDTVTLLVRDDGSPILIVSADCRMKALVLPIKR